MIVLRSRAALAVGASLLLGACAGLNRPTPVGPPDASFAKPRLQSFSVSGRIAAHKGNDAMSGSFRWRHAPDSDQLDFASPLGQNLARLVRSDQGIVYVGSDGKQVRAADWESLTARELGYSLPVAGLTYWVQAAPAPGAPYDESADTQRRPGELRQQGWTVQYQAYDAQDLPTRIRLSSGEVEIRLAIDSWQAENASARP